MWSIYTTTVIQIIIPLDVDKTSEWYICFILVPIPNEKSVTVYGPSAVKSSTNHTGPGHRSLTANDILLKITLVQYITLIDTSSGYHNLKCG